MIAAGRDATGGSARGRSGSRPPAGPGKGGSDAAGASGKIRAMALLARFCATLYVAWTFTVLAHVAEVIAIAADMPALMGDVIANLALAAWYLALSAAIVLALAAWTRLDRQRWALAGVVAVSTFTELARVARQLAALDARRRLARGTLSRPGGGGFQSCPGALRRLAGRGARRGSRPYDRGSEPSASAPRPVKGRPSRRQVASSP